MATSNDRKKIDLRGMHPKNIDTGKDITLCTKIRFTGFLILKNGPVNRKIKLTHDNNKLKIYTLRLFWI